MERLIGHKIKSITLDNDGYVLTIVTDRSTFKYVTEGDCCAYAYINDFDQEAANALCGHIVHKVGTYGFCSIEDAYGEAVDTQFYSIQTHGGDLEIELRTEHNGYYSGWISFLSETPHENNEAC